MAHCGLAAYGSDMLLPNTSDSCYFYKMNEVTTRPAPGWLVELAGHAFDLRHWEQSLKPPFDPWFERVPHGPNCIYSLRSRSFVDAQCADEVKELAIPLINRLNGALAIAADAERVTFESVFRIDDQGSMSFYITFEDHVRVRDAMEIEVRDGSGTLIPPPPPEPSMAQKWAAVADNDDAIADMLTFVGRADNWFDIYKTIELAESLSGDERQLPKLLGVSRAKYKNMRTTANFFRHARGYRPKVLTDITDARALLSTIVEKILTQRVDHFG
jgi:hypothetical protein